MQLLALLRSRVGVRMVKLKRSLFVRALILFRCRIWTEPIETAPKVDALLVSMFTPLGNAVILK
jgi:hypothetical protein